MAIKKPAATNERGESLPLTVDELRQGLKLYENLLRGEISRIASEEPVARVLH